MDYTAIKIFIFVIFVMSCKTNPPTPTVRTMSMSADLFFAEWSSCNSGVCGTIQVNSCHRTQTDPDNFFGYVVRVLQRNGYEVSVDGRNSCLEFTINTSVEEVHDDLQLLDQ